jgi:zinc resistance-associated protein
MKALATLTAASVLTLVGAAAIAQQAAPSSAAPNAPTATAPAPAPAPRGAMGRADLDAMTDARLAGIQAGLKLNDEQRRLWGPVEQALRAEMAERAERIAERAERREERAERREERRERRAEGRQAGAAVAPRDRVDFMERIERRAERASEQAERLRNMTAAMKPFWASLDEQQRRLLPRLVRDARGDRGRRDDRDGRGDRRPWRH